MSEAHKRSYRHPKYKTAYRVSNCSEYEKSLRDREDIAIWFSQDAINTWRPAKMAKRGGQPIYSDTPKSVVSPSQRDRHMILRDGRPQWKRRSGYYLQSHAENVFFRYQTILGGRLRARRTESQEREVAIGCVVLNRMRAPGRPQS